MRRVVGLAAVALALACAGRKAQEAPEPPQAPRYSDAEIAAVKNPHAVRGEPFCLACHDQERGPALRMQPVELCRRCHEFAMGNHPVKVVQKVPVAGLPLLEGGKMACHTCHDPHAIRKPGDGLRKSFNDLCMSCHSKGGSAKVHREHGQKPKP